MGRFDSQYEYASIERGMQADLQKPVGQTLLWYVFDSSGSMWDPVYDVASSETGAGRVWKNPVKVRVLSTQRSEGAAQIENGLYTVDSLHIVCSIDEATRSLLDMVDDWHAHLDDRIVFNKTLFSPTSIQERGLLGQNSYTVIGVDAKQVTREEAVNDVTFADFYN